MIITFLICFNFSFGQWYKISSKDIFGYGAMALSGVAYGVNQSISHHHLGKGSQFWDKDISWANKYKNFPSDQSAAYFGSKSFLCWTSDGQHLSQFISTTFVIGGTGLLVWDLKDELKGTKKRDKWKVLVFKKILIPVLIRSLSFELCFNNL